MKYSLFKKQLHLPDPMRSDFAHEHSIRLAPVWTQFRLSDQTITLDFTPCEIETMFCSLELVRECGEIDIISHVLCSIDSTTSTSKREMQYWGLIKSIE